MRYKKLTLYYDKNDAGHIKANLDCHFPGACLTDPYPVSESLPSDIYRYLEASTNIQSENGNIRSTAEAIVAQCKSQQHAVEEITKWVRGNIIYENPTNKIPQDALSVYNRVPKKGNCDGFTNLAIALLRSIGIPARYVSGMQVRQAYKIPYKVGYTLTLGANPTDAHAVYEVYYPVAGEWLRSDAQGYSNLSNPNFVKYGHGVDGDQVPPLRIKYLETGTGDVSLSANYNTRVDELNPFYSYEDEELFTGSNNGETLLGWGVGSNKYGCHRNYVGLGDAVEITSGPSVIQNGSSYNYSARFYSGEGNTWAENWSWEMELYHTGGSYVVAFEDEGFSSFTADIPLELLPYTWHRNPAGNIPGTVRVTVLINDGDIRSYDMPIELDMICLTETYANYEFWRYHYIRACKIHSSDAVILDGVDVTFDHEEGVVIEKNFETNSCASFRIR